MTRILSAVWNGLFYGSERKIVQKIVHNDGDDLWVAVYDVVKSSHASPLIQRLDFLRHATAQFCIVTFWYKSGTDLDEEGFQRAYFRQKEIHYVDTRQEILRVLDYLGVDVEQFTYPWKVDFPMGT